MLAIAAWEKGGLGAPRVGRVRMRPQRLGHASLTSRSESAIPPPVEQEKRTSLESHKQATVSAIVEERKSPKKDAVLPLLRN